MTISSISRVTSNLHLSGIWEELCEIDFTGSKIDSKNAKVTHSPDVHFLEGESCWTIGEDQGFIQMTTSLFPVTNKRFFLTITHADPMLRVGDSPEIIINVNGETTATLIPPNDRYETELIEITDFVRKGKNTIRLEAINIHRYQIQKITLFEDVP